MRHLISSSILALSLALSTSVNAEEWFRLNLDAPVFFGAGVPDIGENNPITFVVNGDAAGSSVDGRDLGTINIPITVNGIDASHTVDVDGLPDGASWNGSAILWSPASEGTYDLTIEVRDENGALVASQGLELVIHLPLTASVPETAYEVAVGDDLTITPTAANAIGALQWGSTPSELPEWLNFDAATGVIDVDTTSANELENIVLTAVDQSDMTQASTEPFSVTVSSACDVWTARPAAEANAWRSVTYGNGQFVAVANTGTNRVMTSSDGITWTARAAAEANEWFSVAYGNGLFVAVASSGHVMTSTDGVIWTSRTAAQANSWRSVAYGNGQFVAVAINGVNRVMTSADGITWTRRTAAEANGWNSVTYGNGQFVAVANTGTNRVMTSADGVAWTARLAAETNGWHSVTYGDGKFVAVANTGTNRVMTSADGVTWAARAPAETNQWYSVTYGSGLFLAVAIDGTKRVMTSPDGITWTGRTAAEASGWYSVTHGNEKFVAVAYNSTNRVMTLDCH